MDTMLILKAVLLSGIILESKSIIVSSWPISENPIPSTTSKSRRDVTTPSSSSSSSVNWSTDANNFQGYSDAPSSRESSQAATTVQTNAAFKPTQSVTHSPYRRHETTLKTVQHGPSLRAGQFVQTTSALPVLQGGFRASHHPRQPTSTDGYQQPSTSHGPTSGQRPRNNGANGGNRNSRYSEPIKSSPQTKLNLFSSLGGSQNFGNGNIVPATRSNRQSPTGFEGFDDPSKFNFGPSNVFNVQTAPHASNAHGFGNPVQKNSFNNGFKNVDVPETSFASGFSAAPGFASFNKLGDNYGRSANAGYVGKQISNPLQFQNGPQISGFLKAFENEPVFLGTGTNYQTQPSSGLNVDFGKSNPSTSPSGPGYFPSAFGNYQPRASPVRTSSSALQLPRFKAANVNPFGNNGFATPEGGYQLLANQPQLHFTGTRPLQTVGAVKPPIFHSNRPFEHIRTDVEVINKKKPQLPETESSFEHDFDGVFKTVKDFNPDEVDVSAPAKNPEREISFEVPRSNLFNSYDEAFGKYSKLASAEQNSGKVGTKPVHPSAEDDDEREDKSGEYRSNYSDERGPTGSYEDEDEEESRRSEQHEVRDKRGRKNEKKDDEDDDDDDDEDGSEAYKSYGVDFEKDFEESYRKELPKNDYVHVKEVPEIDDPAPKSKKRPTSGKAPRTSRGGTRQKSRHVTQDASEDPKAYETYTTHNYEKPKFTYNDNEGHGSGISYARTKSSETDDEQPYGYKIPRNRGTTKYEKNYDHETTTSDDERPDDRSKKASNNREDERSHKSSRQSSDDARLGSSTLSPIEIVNGLTFPPFGNGSERPSREKASGAIDPYGAPSHVVRAFVNPEERDYRYRRVDQQPLTYFANDRRV